jgi:ParB family chromosome partitioning protein
VETSKLKPNPLQPRSTFDEKSIQELARSIKKSGILQPIVVVPENDHYKIIIGERRWRASQKIGLAKVPVLIRPMKEESQIEASLIENLQREDLNPIEIALAYQKMIQELGYTQAETAEKVGKDRASVANYIRLLKLPPKIQDYLSEGKLTMGHARALIPLEKTETQLACAEEIVKNKFSVRDVEKMITGMKKKSRRKLPASGDPDLLALQENFINILGTKVTISGNPEKGVVKIHYFSMEELNRIFELIKGEKT